MAIYIEILEVGSNVVMSGTGTANTSSLTSGGTLSVGSVIYPSADNVTLLSAGLTEVREWTGITGIFPDMGPGSFTQSFNRTGTYSLGIMENYLGDVTLYLDTAYVSGTEIGPTTATFNSTNFTTLGINPGTYTWSWGSGPTADSFTVQVGPLSPTPTPTETAAVTPTPTNTPTETASVTPTPTAQPALLNLYLNEVGNDIVATGNGTVNILGLSNPQNFGGATLLNANNAAIIINNGTPNFLSYDGLSGPQDIGPGSSYLGADSTNSNFPFGIYGALGKVLLPIGYSGQTLTGESTYNNITFAGEGFNPGTYTWTYGSGSNTGSIVLQVGPLNPTPTPTPTPTETAAVTPTPTNTPTETASVTPTPTETPTNTPTETAAVTPTPTETAAITPTPTETAAVTPTPSVTETPSVTPTPTATTPVLPTPTPTATNPSLLITVDATYNPGSIWVTYVATSTGPVDSDVTITFDNTLGVIDGSPYVITASITIPSGQSTGTTTYYLPEGIYANLDFTSTFDNVTTTYTGGTFGFVVNTESVFDNETIAITANTEYIVCNVCGDTATEINPPHPVWTGLYGETIIQANAVQLGGRNGLNS
jgi:hypothetical protein